MNKKPSQICRYFAASGNCYYGDSCQFSHGGGFQTDIVGSNRNNSSGSRGDGVGSMLNDSLFQAFSTANGMIGANGAIAPDFLPAESKLKLYMGKISPSFGGPNGFMGNGMMTDFENNQCGFYPSTSSPPHKYNISSQSHIPSNMSIPSPLTSSFSQMSLNPASHSSAPPKLLHSASSPSFQTGIGGMGETPHGTIFRPISNGNNGSPRLTPTPPDVNGGGMAVRRKISKSPAVTPDNLSGTPSTAAVFQEYVGGTTYFYCAEEPPYSQPAAILPNFNAYVTPPSNIAHLKPKGLGMASFFVSNDLKLELQQRQSLSLASVDIAQFPDLPQEVDTYHTIVPLEPPTKSAVADRAGFFSYPTTAYKGTNIKDGLVYCLRRIHGFRLINTKCLGMVEMWKKQQHSNICQLREVFTTKQFGDHSLVFVYDYHPGAETLKYRHFSGFSRHSGSVLSFFEDEMTPKSRSGSAMKNQQALLPESLIWCYIVQLTSALRAIHSAGLAARTIDPSKILVIGKSGRLLVNCCGIFDVLTFDQTQANPVGMLQHYQQEDLVNLGRLVLTLACNSLLAVQRDSVPSSMELVTRHYSPDLKNLIVYLLTPQPRMRTVNEIMPMIGARFYSQLDAAQMKIDLLEHELTKELENGRLFRLLCKLGVVNERPDLNLDPSWSDTGDRYLVKLFRDYVFHQVTEDGRPWLDMAHIVQCLNKVDAGSAEKITLMSRDEQNVLVVSFADIKRCLEGSFSEVLVNSGENIDVSEGLSLS